MPVLKLTVLKLTTTAMPQPAAVLTSPALLLMLMLATSARAEIYIYTGPDGERMVSDRPLLRDTPEYELVSRRDTLANAGHILADRPLAVVEMQDMKNYIASASREFNVDPDLVEAVVQVESGFNPNAVSHKGATGLMQLMRDTALRYKVVNRFDARQNVYAGVQHLSHLMERFDGDLPLVLAAYNAGAGNVDKYQGIPPFPETRRYITKVMDYHARFRLVNRD